jgi:hypothetical protein
MLLNIFSIKSVSVFCKCQINLNAKYQIEKKINYNWILKILSFFLLKNKFLVLESEKQL